MGAAGLDVLEAGRERVCFPDGALLTDVEDLKSAIAEADPSRLVERLAAAGARRILEDIDVDGPFRDWLTEASARFEQGLAAGVGGVLARLEAQGDWSQARALAETYLARDPLHEAIVAAAIRADIALGEASAARGRFEIIRSGSAEGAAAEDRSATDAPPPEQAGAEPIGEIAPPPMVVVAAFVTDDTSGAEDTLAATLRDEVLSGLSRFHDLRVITDPRGLDMVAADLSAERAGAYALGAALRSGADGRRLIVQLLRSGERHLIWAHRLVVPEINLSETIDEVIAPVVAAVLPTIQEDETRRAGGRPADLSYTRWLLSRGPDAKVKDFAEAQAAVASREAMIAHDPDFAPPYLPLSYLYNPDFQYTRAGGSGEAERARAFDLAKRALALDRSNVQAYTALGWCYLRRRQWRSAKDHFDQALVLNPYHVRRLMEVGYGRLFLGDTTGARALLDRCLLLNPFPRDGFFTDLGLLSLVGGDHERAASYFDLTADPEIWGAIYPLINAHMGGLDPADLRGRAVAAAAGIWPPAEDMTSTAVVGWIARHHPFQDKDVEARFLSASERAFAGL